MVIMMMLLGGTLSTSAGLYKGLDEQGNVTYSDKPFENAEKITPPPITVLDAPQPPTITETPENTDTTEENTQDKEVTKYTRFSISAPKDGETIRNATRISVAVQMTPALDSKHGHTIWLFVDGRAVIKNSRSPLIEIDGRADRGERKVQAQVRNKQGKILNRSKTITVYIKNTSIN